MKTILAAAFMSVALVGCGNSTPEPREDFTPRQPQNQTAAEEEFVYDIQSSGMTDRLAPVPQEDVIELGYLVCNALDEGNSDAEIVEVIIGGGVTRTDALLIVASAMVNLCPEYSSGSSF